MNQRNIKDDKNRAPSYYFILMYNKVKQDKNLNHTNENKLIKMKFKN